MGNAVSGISAIVSGIISGPLAFIFGITSGLAQTSTNGLSLFGTLQMVALPLFLTNNPLPNGYPWSTKTTDNSNPYKESPTTGVVRSYDWTVSRGVLAPDGYQRQMLLVNGAFPGPLIEANWGDTISVTVHNNITGPTEGTAIHWHGFLQTGTPWNDGVPGVTQCPIAPASSYTYTFKAELYGSSWYHSHYSAQYANGLSGPIVIHGPNQKGATYDIDVGPVMLSDWYHKDYQVYLRQILAPNASPTFLSDNNLINGKGNFDCSSVAAGDKTKCTPNAGISKFNFTFGKVHKLRLINSGSEALQRFSIDQHTMTVVANDYVPVQPYNTTVVTLGIGQRVDVLVTANAGNAKSSYWMRSNISSCSLAAQPLAVAAIYYDQADTTKQPASTAWNVPDPGTCANDDLALTKPVYPIALPDASSSHTYNIELFQNASGVTLWKFDNISFRGDYNSPPLLLANMGNTSFPAIWNTRNTGTNSSIRLIVQNTTPASHPMHLHGSNMYVLAEGLGTWDGKTIVNAKNPQRRDVQQVRAGGYVVLQFDTTNPGVWPFHCHIAWHASGGFFLDFIVQPEKIKQLTVPSTVAQTCRDWATWTKTNIPDQIDSGL